MRILDDERCRAFLKAYLTILTLLVGLYIAIDATTNLDEFLRVDDGNLGLFLRMGQFYFLRSGEFILRLNIVVLVMSVVAVFVVRPMLQSRSAGGRLERGGLGR
jgi:hypothetical protein